MEKNHHSRVILGLITLPGGAILGLVAMLIRGPQSLPNFDPSAWANTVTSNLYSIAMALYIFAYVLPYFGFWALYACLAENEHTERAAFYGFMGSILGTSFALPSLGVFAYAGPSVGRLYLGGETHLLQIMSPLLSGLPFAINLLGGVLYLLGTCLFGVAIWRSGDLPKITGMLLGLHGILLVFGFSMFPMLLLSWVLLLIGGAWIAWTLKV